MYLWWIIGCTVHIIYVYWIDGLFNSYFLFFLINRRLSIEYPFIIRYEHLQNTHTIPRNTHTFPRFYLIFMYLEWWPRSWWSCWTRTGRRSATPSPPSSWIPAYSAISPTSRWSPMASAPPPSWPPSLPFRYKLLMLTILIADFSLNNFHWYQFEYYGYNYWYKNMFSQGIHF